MGIELAEQSVEIAAPPEACYHAIVDFETYPEWQHAVISTEVLDRHEDGLGRRVRVVVDAKFRTVTYVLHYHHDPPGRLWWDFVEGHGVHHVEGEYTFEPSGDVTLATYRLGIDAGVPIPGFIARRLNREVMRRSVADLRTEVERRLAAA